VTRRLPRRAGDTWRVLAHQLLPDGTNGDSHHIGSYKTGEDTSVEAGGHTYWSRHTELSGTEFDELVIGRHGLIHLEQQDDNTYWLNVGGVVIWVVADRRGRAQSVSVTGPSDNDGPVPGCHYQLEWSDPDNWTAPRDGA
jgi:hypothetical protein